MPQLLAGPGESCIRVHNEQIDGVNGGGEEERKEEKGGEEERGKEGKVN